MNNISNTTRYYNIRKINILFVIVRMAMGGSERLVYHLARMLDRNIFNPSIAWFHGDEILKEFYDLKIPLYHVPKPKRFDPFAMYKIGKIIREKDIHIVNAHHFMPMVYSFYGCKVMNHRKLICTLHSEWEIEQIPWRWRKIGSYLLNRADGVIGVSTAVSKLIQENFNNKHASNTITITNGVDLGSFSRSRDKAALRKKLGLENNGKVIGIVANFKKIKNHIFLLKAFNELLKDYKHVKLLLIGQGFENDPENSEQEIRRFIKENGLGNGILLLGYRSDIPELLSIIDIFCLTSFKEGLPFSLIEAMAAGLPVVGTDVEGIRDIIIPNKNGFLVQLDDIEGLKKVLLVLLQDDSMRRRMGQESKEMANSRYSLSRMVNEYQNLFLSVLEKKH